MSIDDYSGGFDEPYDVGDFTGQDYASATATGRETYDDGQSPVRYFSPVERYAQETLPEIIQQLRKASPTGIITNLINKGLDVYNKGKEVIEETFEPEKKTDIGILENMDRAELTDAGRAILAGMQNTNRRLPPVTQTADLDLKELLTSPGVLGKALNYTQPFIQNLLPEGINFDAGTIYNKEQDEFQPRIQFTIPFSTG